MPTGYTADLMEHGQSFNDFVLGCARAFGALIMMRDEPSDAPIPEKFEPSDYSTRKIAEAKAELSRLQLMSADERIAFGVEARDEEVARYNEWLLRQTEQNRRLVDMERKVKAWTPPSDDHKQFKHFMLEQIRISKNDLEYIQRNLDEAYHKAPVSYYSEAVMKAERDIDYHAEEHAKELERTEGRNRWIRQLRESLAKICTDISKET